MKKSSQTVETDSVSDPDSVGFLDPNPHSECITDSGVKSAKTERKKTEQKNPSKRAILV
jgi:hypothetical protein